MHHKLFNSVNQQEKITKREDNFSQHTFASLLHKDLIE